MGGGLSNIILYVENPSRYRVHLTLSRAKGSKVAHFSPVSWVHLVRTSLRVWFMRSTYPDLWGRLAQCNFQLIFNVFFMSCETFAMKAEPLSEPKVIGRPNQGIISWNNFLVTLVAVSVLAG